MASALSDPAALMHLATDPAPTGATPPRSRSLDQVLAGYARLPVTVAERLRTLAAMLREDDEDDEICLKSVEGLCRFLTHHPVAIPEVVADGDGDVVAEWLDERAGRLTMRFRASGLVEFALAGGTEAGDPRRVRLCGTEASGRAVRSVRAMTGHFPYA